MFVCVPGMNGVGVLRQELIASTSWPYVRVCVCVSVDRMWGQSAGQQRELLLSRFPEWILGLHALHLEDIGHTGREGMSA